MARIERQARAPIGFVPASDGSQKGKVEAAGDVPMVINPDVVEVDLDDI